MAYRYLARNQPLSHHLVAGMQGKKLEIQSAQHRAPLPG